MESGVLGLYHYVLDIIINSPSHPLSLTPTSGPNSTVVLSTTRWSELFITTKNRNYNDICPMCSRFTGGRNTLGNSEEKMGL